MLAEIEIQLKALVNERDLIKTLQTRFKKFFVGSQLQYPKYDIRRAVFYMTYTCTQQEDIEQIVASIESESSYAAHRNEFKYVY